MNLDDIVPCPQCGEAVYFYTEPSNMETKILWMCKCFKTEAEYQDYLEDCD